MLVAADQCELIEWPAQVLNINPVEIMWSEMKTMQETRSIFPPRDSDVLRTILGRRSVVWALCLIPNCVHTKTNAVHGWSSGIMEIMLKMPGLENGPFTG